MRSKLYVVLGIAAVAAFSLFASTQVWINLTLVQGSAAVDSLSLSGQAMNPTLSPVAVAALAAALALTIAGRIFRYVLGALVVVLGLGLTLIAYGINVSPLDSAASQLTEITGITGEAQSDLVALTVTTLWPVLTMVAGAVLSCVGLVVLIVSHKWKRGGRKYESNLAPVHSESTESDHRASTRATRSQTEPDRISDWEMLSSGDDPSDTLDKP